MNKYLVFITITSLLLVSCSYAIPTTGPTPTPTRLEPLSGQLQFSLAETADHVTLKLQTEREYPDYNNIISVSLATTNTQHLEIKVEGIQRCNMCQPMVGPATANFQLGSIQGSYELIFDYLNSKDVFHMLVTTSNITITPSNQETFVEPARLEWKRLPQDALWIVVHNEGVYDGRGNWRPLDRTTFDELSMQFFNALEGLGATQFSPPEGHYSNALFVPPWENWRTSKGDRTVIPLAKDSWYELRWPDIRYYHYAGEWRNIETLVESYRSKGLSIYAFDWAGKRIFAIKKEEPQ
jgi:hypothetical protein